MVSWMQKYNTQNNRIWRSLSRLQIDGLIGIEASRCCCSSSMTCTSTCCSATLSHFASLGVESSQNQVKPQSTTEARPSMMNIHCQPCQPKPSSCNRAPDSGPEISEATAEPLRKMAIALPRSTPGSQRVK